MKQGKAGKKTRGKMAAKDLGVDKRGGRSVKGGRITNVRVNANALAGGSAAGATPVIASISTN